MGHAEIFICVNTNVRGKMGEISDAETKVRLSFNIKLDSGIWSKTLT